MVGESSITNILLRMLGNDIRSDIDNYVDNICSKDFMVMNSLEQVDSVFKESLEQFLNNLSLEELMDLRSYTGYNYKNINSILRGNWNYDKNGKLNEEKNIEYRKLADKISELLGRFNMPKIDFVTFRGATLTSFSSYGITDISQFKNLEGKFLYDQGFTSTSILEETSYFNKDLGDGKKYNVEIRYLISSECNDGALLIDNNTSYSSNQNEYLLDKGTLSKVISVKIDESKNNAVLTVVVIPKKIWNLTENRNKANSKS